MTIQFIRLVLFFNLVLTTGLSYCQTNNNPTYKNGETEYIIGKTYKTTGQPLVKRSSTPKSKFLKSIGLKSIPSGYEIDHIAPLSQGGEDVPDNMQLLTVGQHKLKTAIERGEVAKVNHSDVFYSNFDYNTQKPAGVRTKDDWQIQQYIPASEIDRELNSKKVLLTGSRGGTYYYNSNGKKSYVKSKTYTKLAESSNANNPSSNNVIGGAPNTPSTGYKGHEIQTGPRGGQFYINSNGNKTYIKKN